MKDYSNIGFYPAKKGTLYKTIQQVFNEVVQILLKYTDLDAIYCFGFQSHSLNKQTVLGDTFYKKEKKWEFSLLLMGKNIPANSTANLADLVTQQLGGKIKLSLLCYTPKQIALSNNEHRHLFKKIIQSGWLIYGNPHELVKLNLTNLPDLNYKGIIEFTQNRMTIANGFIKNAPLFYDQPLTCAYLVRTAIKQVLLAILYAYIHYHPNQFHIQYLLQLCTNCCNLSENIFPNTLLELEICKKLFKTYHNDLRFRSTDIYSKEDVKLFYQCSLSFKDQVEPLIHKRIFKLKSKAYEKRG
jgi:hypothetical protein